MHDWAAPIDLYCERTSAAFWAEPVNALTNAAFLIAAAAALVAWRRGGRRDLPVLALILLVAAIGIGSFVFHTVATRAGMLADTVPIAVFMLSYLGLAVRRYLGFSWRGVVLCLGGFMLVATAVGRLAAPLGPWRGSIAYLPALLALPVVALAMRARAHGAEAGARRAIAAALERTAVLFLVSLALRSVDPEVCAAVPVGTHFGWHLLNALVLYRLIVTALRHGAPAPRAAVP